MLASGSTTKRLEMRHIFSESFTRRPITGDNLHEGQLSTLRVFGGSFCGFKAQKLRFLPSSLEADEVKGFSFARRVIWMQLSDRVAHGRIHQSLVHAVLNPTFSGSLFWSFWNSVQLEGLQAQCTGTFWTFTLCKLCALTAAKCYVQKISLQYWLWTSKGVWKYPYPVDAIHNTMSKRSLGFYTFLSMVGCILFAWGCGCANEAHHGKSWHGM